MMQLLLYTTTFISSLIFIRMNHPLAMGLMLLIQTLQVCLLTGLMTKSFWFSYILFLIFLGGMLVLFIYVTALASNEMFSLSMKLTVTCLILLTTLMLTSMIIDKSLTAQFTPNLETLPTNTLLLLPENSLSLYKLYNFPTNIVTILLMNYLLVTLIAVVKITDLFYGPLRMTN
uniref:NADH-ubiquinone oxidoreductase chain 6 n=1 Tax=Bactrocera tsuneonis TaxID=104691 RepID=A0A344BNY1_BACUE|nr:NADH dehydrogenase subunit 6 [Bactrocera tsuneonis]AWY19071.1 NADH dehydrogenase subunit 6 [Bactrocera tsuneonis]UKG21050.1 NADH dehydrogenase subunit 6 [Bactrocera tsuneonis]